MQLAKADMRKRGRRAVADGGWRSGRVVLRGCALGWAGWRRALGELRERGIQGFEGRYNNDGADGDDGGGGGRVFRAGGRASEPTSSREPEHA
jgi:hypothetical protein